MAYQAIITKYLGYTNHRQSRIKATASAGSMIFPYDHALGTEQNHHAAAKAFAEQHGWLGVWHCGAMPQGNGNVYVNQSANDSFEVRVA